MEVSISSTEEVQRNGFQVEEPSGDHSSDTPDVVMKNVLYARHITDDDRLEEFTPTEPTQNVPSAENQDSDLSEGQVTGSVIVTSDGVEEDETTDRTKQDQRYDQTHGQIADESRESTESYIEKDKRIAPDSSVLLPSWNQRRAFGCPIVISDMRGSDSLNFSKAEKRLRCKLAAAYRLADVFGWTDGVNASISGLTNTRDMLMSPLPILHHEVTASSLVKIPLGPPSSADLESSDPLVDSAERTLHAAIYRIREDVQCVMHFSSPFTIAFSSLRCGLLPLCPEAMELGEISYSEYKGAIFSEEEEKLLSLIQKPNSKVMVLRNFGVVVCGDTVEQALHLAQNLMDAIQTQVNILPVGLSNLYVPSEEKQKDIFKTTCQSPPNIVPATLDRCLQDVQFEGFMRMLDSAGYQTGYVYRHPLASKRTVRSHSLMEVTPPGPRLLSPDVSAQGKLLPYDPSRSVTPSSLRQEKLRGCKSVAENGHGEMSISHKFIPLGTDVREYKRKVKEIRKDFLPKGASSGPQSTVLEGLTWEEARRIQESQSGPGVVKVTAASRGIIQREHQKSAVFFKEFSTANPFDTANEKEFDSYMKEVQRKTTSPEPPVSSDVQPNGVPKADSKKEAEVDQRFASKDLEEPKKPEVEKVKVEPTIQSKSHSMLRDAEAGRGSDSPTGTGTASEGKTPLPSSTVDKSENVRTGIPGDRTESLPETEQPTVTMAAQEPPSMKPEKTETPPTGVVMGSVTPVKEEIPRPSQTTPSPVSPSGHESNAAKLKKSKSVNEEVVKEEKTAAQELSPEGVEMRTKDKEKKKKRGLSAIFSKKKEK